MKKANKNAIFFTKAFKLQKYNIKEKYPILKAF